MHNTLYILPLKSTIFVNDIKLFVEMWITDHKQGVIMSKKYFMHKKLINNDVIE